MATDGDWISFNMIQRGTVSYERISHLLKEQSDVKESENPLSEIKLEHWFMILMLSIMIMNKLYLISTLL